MISAAAVRLNARESLQEFRKNRLQILSVGFGSWLEPLIFEATSNGDFHLSVDVVLDSEEETNLKWFLKELGYQANLYRKSEIICQLDLRWEK